jgi:type I restriction enzyme S subunit
MTQVTTTQNGWVETTLGEVISSGDFEIKNKLRLPISSEIRAKRKGCYPYYGAASAIDFIDDYQLEGFHLLIAEDGTVTSNGVNPMLQLVNGKFNVSNHAHILQGKEKWKTKFLFYVLSNININPFITGAVQPKLSKENLLKISFLLPPLPEQKAIAAVLSSLDDKIELLREQNKTLEETAQAIFKELLGKYEGVDSLSEGLDNFKLRQVFTFLKGRKPSETSEIKQEEFIPQILIDTFNGGKIIYANPNNTVISEEDDLIMVMDGASSGRIEFGFAGIIGSTLAMLKTEKNIRSILYFFLKSKEKDIQGKTTGSAIPHTDKEKVYSYEIVLPTEESEIHKVDLMLSSFRKKIILNRFQIQTLSTLRDTLLPRLMRGEVRVKDFNSKKI